MPPPGNETGNETGIDVGLKVFRGTAQEEAVETPRHYRRAEKPLAKAQQRLARRQKGSKRHEKARKLVAKHHQKVHRPRRDFDHTTARALVRQ